MVHGVIMTGDTVSIPGFMECHGIMTPGTGGTTLGVTTLGTTSPITTLGITTTTGIITHTTTRGTTVRLLRRITTHGTTDHVRTAGLNSMQEGLDTEWQAFPTPA